MVPLWVLFVVVGVVIAAAIWLHIGTARRQAQRTLDRMLNQQLARPALPQPEQAVDPEHVDR